MINLYKHYNTRRRTTETDNTRRRTTETGKRPISQKRRYIYNAFDSIVRSVTRSLFSFRRGWSGWSTLTSLVDGARRGWSGQSTLASLVELARNRRRTNKIAGLPLDCHLIRMVCLFCTSANQMHYSFIYGLAILVLICSSVWLKANLKLNWVVSQLKCFLLHIH